MRGFTLIELIVTFAVVAITVAFGIPSFKDTLDSHHARTSLSKLHLTFQRARTIALQSASDIIVCPMTELKCSGSWTQSLSVFGDANNNLTLDDDEQLYMRVGEGVNNGYWQKKKATQNYIKFNFIGHAYGSATTFLYCPNSNKEIYAKQLVISFQGRIRINSYLNDQKTPYPNVNPLNCSSHQP